MLEREFIVITCRFRNHFAPISRPSSRTLSVRATETRRIISPSDGQSRFDAGPPFSLLQSCFNGDRLYRVCSSRFFHASFHQPRRNYATIKVPSNLFPDFFNFFFILYRKKIFPFQVALDYPRFSYYLEFY